LTPVLDFLSSGKIYEGGNLKKEGFILTYDFEDVSLSWVEVKNGETEQFTSWWPGSRERGTQKGPGQDIACKDMPSVTLFPQVVPTSYFSLPSNNAIILRLYERLIHSSGQSSHYLIVSVNTITDTPRCALLIVWKLLNLIKLTVKIKILTLHHIS
jgi:hypothetical protein